MILVDLEERTLMSYVADCVGAIAKAQGYKELKLYSDMIRKKHEKPQTAQDIIKHVKQLFSE